MYHIFHKTTPIWITNYMHYNTYHIIHMKTYYTIYIISFGTNCTAINFSHRHVWMKSYSVISSISLEPNIGLLVLPDRVTTLVFDDGLLGSNTLLENLT